jgi:hypothetical protein
LADVGIRQYALLVSNAPEVWIGLAEVVPQAACELLEEGKGAFVNVLTLTTNADEFQRKLVRVCRDYKLELVGLENCEPFTQRHLRSGVDQDLAEMADTLRNPAYVLFGTLYTYPRLM